MSTPPWQTTATVWPGWAATMPAMAVTTRPWKLGPSTPSSCSAPVASDFHTGSSPPGAPRSGCRSWPGGPTRPGRRRCAHRDRSPRPAARPSGRRGAAGCCTPRRDPPTPATRPAAGLRPTLRRQLRIGRSLDQLDPHTAARGGSAAAPSGTLRGAARQGEAAQPVGTRWRSARRCTACRPEGTTSRLRYAKSTPVCPRPWLRGRGATACGGGPSRSRRACRRRR